MGLKQETAGNNSFVTIVWLKKWDDEKLNFLVKKWDSEEKWNVLTGELEKIELSSYEYEWQKRDTVKITIADVTEKYVISTAFTTIAKSLLNSLASAETFWQLELKLYVNKKGYNSIYVANDNTRLEWKYTIEELNSKVDKIQKKNGEVVMDYSELDEFYKNTVVKQIQETIEKSKIKQEEFKF